MAAALLRSARVTGRGGPALGLCRRAVVQQCRGTSGEAEARTVSVINKEVTVMTESLYRYVLDHTREPPVLAELREETHRLNGSGMQVSPEQGAFMHLLTLLTGARKTLDIGVFTGYSSISVARALPEGGRLIACDTDQKVLEVAKRYWQKAGVEDKVEARVGPAADSMRQLLDAGEAGTFDFIFIDADKRRYKEYYELALQLLRPGGFLGVDNTLWYGKVADPDVNDKNTVAIRELNDWMARDERVDCAVVPIGDGMTLCRKR